MSFPATREASPSVEAAPRIRSVAQAHYVVGPLYDWVWFLAPPLASLVLGLGLAGSRFFEEPIQIWGSESTAAGVAIGALIHAHLVIVFARSHANGAILKRHPVRFLAVPVVVVAVLSASHVALIVGAVLATFWDVYHSGMQTFGFARMYDRRAGNDPAAGRRLDIWLNQLLYAGPILAGATLMDHAGDLESLEGVGILLFSGAPGWLEAHQGLLARMLLGAGGCFLVGYLLAYLRLARRGYQISWLKVYLLVSTGAVSLVAWGFNPFGQAFFIMNLFHAIQYFGIVWAFEGKRLTRLVGAEGMPGGRIVSVSVLAMFAIAYGLWVGSLATGPEWMLAVALAVSLLHFWYDGFIWSVRRSDA